MNTLNLNVRTGLRLVAFVLSFAFAGWSAAPAAAAPVRLPASQVLENLTEDLEEVVETARERMERVVTRASFYLEERAERGQSRAKLQKYADGQKKSLRSIARSGLAQTNRIVGNGMFQLRRAPGYERDMQNELFFQQDVAVDGLDDAVDEFSEALDRAVDEALAAVEEEGAGSDD
ncbi:MAG: hypothetical protein SFZ24_00250 [Planctomycetota bacterium]|nr:hypothetical protein [Planctomycetota bacterium]